MSILDFLNDIKIEAVPESRKSSAIVKKQRGPEASALAIRIWKDGSVYPSKALVDKFDLQYKPATITKETDASGNQRRKLSFNNGTGYGFDVVDTDKWNECKTPKRFIALAVVPKDQPKVDLFAATRYNEDGTPVSDVLDQGSSTFGSEEFLPMIKEVYGVEPNVEGFIDLIVETSVNLKSISANGIFLFHKTIARGKDQGKPTYERRENVDIFAITPALFSAQPETVEELNVAEGAE